MIDAKSLFEATRVGRYVGSGTTFERSAAEWRDGDAFVGLNRPQLVQLDELVKSSSFAQYLQHPNQEVCALAQAVVRLTQQPRRRSLWWKWRDLWASAEPTVSIAMEYVRDVQQARQNLWEKIRE